MNKQLSWDGIEAWIETLEPLRKQYLGELTTLLNESQKKFDSKSLIEPAFRDWSNFRPLKTEDENDWSDWLAHLLEKSTTGYFANLLLNYGTYEDKNDYALPKVVRELPIATSEDEQNRRPDLLIKWKDGTFTHIEVKKYDSDFIKTFPTSKYINEYFKTSAQHFILIPEESREKCLKELDKEKNKFPSIKINLLIWNDVAASLRNTLINPDNKESNEWNVWANSFLGCIEQKLLGFTAFNQKLPMQGITKLINHHNKLLEYKNMPNLKEEEFKFLMEGVSIYSQAKNSISHFEDLVKKRITEFLSGHYWKQYVNLEKSFITSYPKSYSLDYIEYYFEFNFDKKKIIDLQVHFLSNPAMIVTRIYLENDKRNSIQLKTLENFNDIKVIKDPYGYYFKLVPDFTQKFNLEKYLDILMEATLAHEGYIKQSNQT